MSSGPDRVGHPQGVLLGMSGGVDSAVAALLLQRRRHPVVGCTLILWAEEGTRETTPEAVMRARRVAFDLGIPHLTIDVREIFASTVVDYFVKEYQAGRTPNPCAKCNARVRFGLMAGIAAFLGLDHIATGHYARTVGPERRLARAVDSLKDQSYVLAEVQPSLISRTLFPLGEMTKTEARGLAAEAGLAAYDAPDSQEICFVPDDDHRRFLRERLGDLPGDIVDLQGRRLGSHRGTYNFTIGQRRGIGIAAEAPLYVVGLDQGRREVRVGPEGSLGVTSVTAEAAVWHAPAPRGSIWLQIRSNGAPLRGRFTRATLAGAEEGGQEEQAGRSFSVELDEPATGVACGQTAVVYEDDLVVCAGTIAKAAGRHRSEGSGSDDMGTTDCKEPMI